MNLLRRSKTILLVLFLISAGITMLSALGSPSGTGLAKTVAAQETVINYLPAVLATEGGIPPVCYKLTITREGEGSYPTALPTKSAGCQDEHTYYQGHTIILSGAVPMTGWAISGWAGTIDDNITDGINAVEMPSGDHTAGVKYVLDNVCYDLTLAHTGQGSDPVATPLKSDVCIEEHRYLSGELIQLSGATAAADWYIVGWEGTGDDASTADSNTVTMPAGSHTAKVNYAENCYILTISHTGMGSDPVATPSKSVTCALENSYVAGEEIQLSGALPDLNWHITGWLGTDDDLSMADSNLVTMPMADHGVSVDYAETCYDLTLDHTGQGSDPEAAPLKSAVCEQDNSYVAGELISLSGAVPAAEWFIGTWNGTDNDSSNASTNTATMPGADHTVAVNYAESCFRLTIYHTGQGSDPAASPPKSAACDQNGTYVPGEKIDLIDAVPSAGWEVGGWSGTDDNGSTSDNNRVTMPASNRSAAVNYVRACYTLTTTHSGNGADPTASPTNSSLCALGTYTAGTAIALRAAPDDGWNVEKWSNTDDDTIKEIDNTLTMPAQNHTVDVEYKGTCFNLTIGKTGLGSVPEASPSQYDYCSSGKYTAGDPIQFSNAVPAAHWYISGWTGTDNDNSTADNNSVIMPPNNHAVLVDYLQICYQLTLGHTGNGSDPTALPLKSTNCSSNGEYVYNEVIALTATPDTGYHVNSWTNTDNDSSTSTSNQVTMPAHAVTVSVDYGQSCYALTLSHAGNGSDPAVSPLKSTNCSSNGEYVYNEVIALTATPDTGYQVNSWTNTDDDGSTSTSNQVTMPAGALSVSVDYGQSCYALTLGHTGNGSDPAVSPLKSTNCSSNGEYVYNEVIALTATPDTGSYVASWTNTDNDSSTSTSNQVTMPAEALSVSVEYGQSCYLLTLGHTGNGSDPAVSPLKSTNCSSNGEYVYNEVIALTATPDTGYQVNSWTNTDDDGSTSTSNQVAMPAVALSVSVDYGQSCYLLTLGHTGNGSDPAVSPLKSTNCSSNGEYVYNEVIALTATPDTGSYVASWTNTDNDNSTSTSNQVTMPAEALSVSVDYGQSCYLLTLGHTGNGSDPAVSPLKSTNCSSNGEYVYNEVIALTATPDTGYQVNSWTNTDDDGSTSTSNQVTMPAEARSVSVDYGQSCYLLTLGHTGQGSDPAALIPKSTICSSNGEYVYNETIGLTGAVPEIGWGIFGWTGTLNDLSVLPTNTVTMPASAHAAGVDYGLVGVTAVQDEGYQFYLYYRWR